MKTQKLSLSWHDGLRKWVAASQSPEAKAMAASPKTAVNRLKRALSLRGLGSVQFEVVVQLPSGAVSAIDRYFAVMADAAEKQRKALEAQIELAELFIDRYGLNRTQAAAAVGLSHSHLGKLLDGKVSRTVALPPSVNPAETIADFVNTKATEHTSVARNARKR